MKARLALVVVLGSAVASCSGSNPVSNAPTPTPTATRIITLGGNLGFGTVDAGVVRTDGILNISNQGNSALTVTGISGPCASSKLSVSPTSGTVAPGGTLTVSVRFAPTGT